QLDGESRWSTIPAGEKSVFLLARGADVNSPDIYGRTPLHVAAAVNHVEMIEFLIGIGGKTIYSKSAVGKTNPSAFYTTPRTFLRGKVCNFVSCFPTLLRVKHIVVAPLVQFPPTT
uniref:Uncharacterized protein n=1 Tax=Callorhinchus milii TaxID=7868 RepID=A0A4W3H618_CALMI